MQGSAPSYRGRFAPTPSGLLHFGSLVTALASWMEARARQGQWLVRIENLDPLREVAGAADAILFTLEAFGLVWDEQVVYQSQRCAAYQEAFDALKALGRVYPCTCSRKQLQAHTAYPGWCRPKTLASPALSLSAPVHTAWRFALNPDQVLAWQDQHQGVQYSMPSTLGDPVILRRDGYWAYQLAVVVDDLQAGITHLVRGRDLLHATPWQCALRLALAPQQPSPVYLHLPLVVDHTGQKLAKSQQALAIDPAHASALLCRALRLLQQPVDPDWQTLAPEALLQAALTVWSLDPLSATTQLTHPSYSSTPTIDIRHPK